MGTDKALLEFGDQLLIQHVLTRLDGMAQEIIITTNHPEGYHFLGLPLFADIIPERGALGGLYTALHAATYPLVAVVACDMPFASPVILQRCRDQLVANADVDAVLPSTEYGLEPLHAVYRRETCLPAIKSAIDAGKWKAISWHGEVHLQVLPPEEVKRLDPDGTAFENVNTPEQLEAAIKQIKEQTRS